MGRVDSLTVVVLVYRVFRRILVVLISVSEEVIPLNKFLAA